MNLSLMVKVYSKLVKILCNDVKIVRKGGLLIRRADKKEEVIHIFSCFSESGQAYFLSMILYNGERFLQCILFKSMYIYVVTAYYHGRSMRTYTSYFLRTLNLKMGL